MEPGIFPPNRFVALPLAVAHTLACLAYAWRLKRFSGNTFSFLWEDHGLPESFAGGVETVLILCLLLSALCIWIRPVRWLALCGAAVMAAEMLAETFAPGAKYPAIYWAEWMVRLATPLAAIHLFQFRTGTRAGVVRLMRFAIAATFAAHGIKALLADPQFVDFLLVFFRHAGLGAVAQDTAVLVLHVIGTIDVLLAAHLLAFKPERNRMVLVWMAVWGAVTACARITYGGMGNWHEVLIRSAHFAMPATLLWLIQSGYMKKRSATP
jgi:hypothetical protein